LQNAFIFDSSFVPMSEGDRAPAISRDEEVVTRRSFLGVLLGFGTVVMGAALSIPLIRFALHPLLTKTTESAGQMSATSMNSNPSPRR